ncbi:hypothetical protein KH5_07090 [Urechidicola sp. KH5]
MSNRISILLMLFLLVGSTVFSQSRDHSLDSIFYAIVNHTVSNQRFISSDLENLKIEFPEEYKGKRTPKLNLNTKAKRLTDLIFINLNAKRDLYEFFGIELLTNAMALNLIDFEMDSSKLYSDIEIVDSSLGYTFSPLMQLNEYLLIAFKYRYTYNSAETMIMVYRFNEQDKRIEFIDNFHHRKMFSIYD